MHNQTTRTTHYMIKIIHFFFANQAVLTRPMGLISSSWTSTRSPATIKAQVVLKSFSTPQSVTCTTAARPSRDAPATPRPTALYLHSHPFSPSLTLQQSTTEPRRSTGYRGEAECFYRSRSVLSFYIRVRYEALICNRGGSC